MILSAEALEIIAYLKTNPGKFFSLQEISRKAGGRRRFEETPGWARNMMSPLLESGLIEVNARGHYRVPGGGQAPAPANPPAPKARKPRGKILGGDYFPASEGPQIVGGDYFPAS
ncbi:MAG TPA: hypothetical protein VG146_19140 [Verrucomicrobiae bacterium]|nr:hypothetical protein [Verrucomicrobiae bacterium]